MIITTFVKVRTCFNEKLIFKDVFLLLRKLYKANFENNVSTEKKNCTEYTGITA